MISLHQQELLKLWHSLNPQPHPETQAEALHRVAGLFQQALGEVRLLFYLKVLPPDLNPLGLVPCLARSLNSSIFVYEGSNGSDYFTFETESFYYLPLKLKGYNFGYLFLESHNSLDYSAQLLVALLAVQTAYNLKELEHPAMAQPCHPDASVSLRIEPAQRRVWIANTPVYMSDNELIFLDLLNRSHQQGQPCPRDLLCGMIYFDEMTLTGMREDRLDSLVARLRDKLKQAAGGQISIKTVRGVGYQLVLGPKSTSETI